MNTWTISKAHAGEFRSAAIELRIRGRNGVRASAIIQPTSLTPQKVGGVVQWHSPELISSVVSAAGDHSPWWQRFLLVWAAVGPNSAHCVPEVAADKWSSFRVVFSDIDGDGRDRFRVCLSRARWRAVFSSTSPEKSNVHLPIPTELRGMNAGSLLIEMANRLALQQSPSTG